MTVSVTIIDNRELEMIYTFFLFIRDKFTRNKPGIPKKIKINLR